MNFYPLKQTTTWLQANVLASEECTKQYLVMPSFVWILGRIGANSNYNYLIIGALRKTDLNGQFLEKT